MDTRPLDSKNAVLVNEPSLSIEPIQQREFIIFANSVERKCYVWTVHDQAFGCRLIFKSRTFLGSGYIVLKVVNAYFYRYAMNSIDRDRVRIWMCLTVLREDYSMRALPFRAFDRTLSCSSIWSTWLSIRAGPPNCRATQRYVYEFGLPIC